MICNCLKRFYKRRLLLQIAAQQERLAKICAATELNITEVEAFIEKTYKRAIADEYIYYMLNMIKANVLRQKSHLEDMNIMNKQLIGYLHDNKSTEGYEFYYAEAGIKRAATNQTADFDDFTRQSKYIDNYFVRQNTRRLNKIARQI